MSCNCVAYKFPHRPGGGKCQDPGEMPECNDCAFALIVHDPYGSGDSWYSEVECTLKQCPWGKNGLS
jgi:hypothetical protein